MYDERLLDGATEPAFEGCSVADAVKRIRKMPSPSKNWHMQTSTYSSCELSLSSLTKTALKSSAIPGLELDDIDECRAITSKKERKAKAKR